MNIEVTIVPISDHIVEHFMSSLVLELQSEVLDPSISVLNLLRKTFNDFFY